MKPTDFSDNFPGKLVQEKDIRTNKDYWAFVPDPLPPEISIDNKTVNLLVEAERALGELVGIGSRLPNPHLLISPFLRREAIVSSRIEGTETTARELLLFEVEKPERENKADVQEVCNYVNALEHGIRRLKSLPVCLRLIKEVHNILLTGVRGEEHRPGEFRDSQNFIGRRDQPIQEARFVPPPVSELQNALNDFEKYVATPDKLPTLVQLAMIHYQFETIHPFTDGNGRIGRLLIPLILCERGQLNQPFLYMSGYFEKNKKDYMDLMLGVSQKGDWSDWINFFIKGVAEQSRDGIWRTNKFCNLWDQYKEKIHEVRASATTIKLVDRLFIYPVVSNKTAKKYLGVTHHSAQNNIRKLVDQGILKELPGRRRNRIYFAPEIIKIIEEENTD